MTPLQRWIFSPIWIFICYSAGKYLIDLDSILFSILGYFAYLLAGGAAWAMIVNPKNFNG